MCTSSAMKCREFKVRRSHLMFTHVAVSSLSVLGLRALTLLKVDPAQEGEGTEGLVSAEEEPGADGAVPS